MYWRLKKITCSGYLFFLWFFGDKSNFLKALLICTFISSLLNSFYLPSCSSQSRNRNTLRLLLMRLEELGLGCACFSERDWEGVCRKLLSLVAVPEVLNMKYRLGFIFICSYSLIISSITRSLNGLNFWLYYI